MSENIKNQFNNPLFDYEGRRIPKQLGQFPVSPSVFIGRENHTRQIHEKLSQKNNHVLLLVNGEGGIGKTTMASQYYFEYINFYSHLIWLVAETSIEDAIMSLALSFDIRFEYNMAQAQKIREIIRVISTLNRPVLVIIDNANDIEDLAASYGLLRQFHDTHILLTSRIEECQDIPTHKINHLTKETSNKLFKHYYKVFKEEEQQLLDEMLKAIGYNTLVIELLAKNLNEFNTGLESHYTLKKLLQDIQRKGVLAIQKSTEIYTFYKLKAAKPEDIITSMYDISPLSDDEKQILSIFGVLPGIVLPYDDLKQFLPNIEMLDRRLINLFKKGWIDYDTATQSFKTNPIISEIVRLENKDRLEKDLKFLVDLIFDKLKYKSPDGHLEGNFEDVKKYVGYTEVFISVYKVLNLKRGKIFEVLGDFQKTYGNAHRALLFFENEKEVFQELCEVFQNDIGLKLNLSIAYEKLGRTYKELHKLQKALLFFEKQKLIIEEFYKDDPLNISLKDALAICYNNIGSVYLGLKKYNKALWCYINEVKLCEELYEISPMALHLKKSLAISYQGLGDTYIALKNKEKSILFYKKFLSLAKELYHDFSNSIDFKNGLAVSYEKLGTAYYIFKDFGYALPLLEDSNILSRELYEAHPNHLSFKNSLAVSHERLGLVNIALGNITQAFLNFEKEINLTKELYESNPDHIIFKDNLMTSYIKLGSICLEISEKAKAMFYLQKASTLWEELKNEHPDYITHHENYSWIEDNLKFVKDKSKK